MNTISIVFEYNSSDVAVIAFEAMLSTKQLLETAAQIARDNQTSVSEITMRFAWKGRDHETFPNHATVD